LLPSRVWSWQGWTGEGSEPTGGHRCLGPLSPQLCSCLSSLATVCVWEECQCLPPPCATPMGLITVVATGGELPCLPPPAVVLLGPSMVPDPGMDGAKEDEGGEGETMIPTT
jgi:hypothetical protein